MKISKYDPASPETFDWTSVSDFSDGDLSPHYLLVELRYLRAISAALSETDTSEMDIIDVSRNTDDLPVELEAIILSCHAEGLEIIEVARSCLREKIWCRLESAAISIHFGYDFIMYFEGEVGSENLRKKINDLGLIIDYSARSPYLTPKK